MIRTLIEVQAEDPYEHARQLDSALDKIGYVPKPGAEAARFESDLYRALHARGMAAHKLVEEYRSAPHKDA